MTAREARFKRTVEGYIKCSGLTKEKIATNLNTTVPTLNKYIEHPDEARLGTLRRLLDMLHVTEEDRGRLKLYD